MLTCGKLYGSPALLSLLLATPFNLQCTHPLLCTSPQVPYVMTTLRITVGGMGSLVWASGTAALEMAIGWTKPMGSVCSALVNMLLLSQTLSSEQNCLPVMPTCLPPHAILISLHHPPLIWYCNFTLATPHGQ